MLHVVGARIDWTRREHLVVGDLRPRPDLPLVLVPRVGCLEEDRGRPCLEDDADHHPLERNVVIVWPFIVAPAHVHAHLLGGDVGHGGIQRLDVGLSDLEELRVTDVLKARMPRHRKVRAIQLQLVAARGDGFILRPHGADQVGEVLFVTGVVGVGLEGRNESGRRGVQKPPHLAAAHGRRETANVVAARLQVYQPDRTDAARPNELLLTHDRGELLAQRRQRRKVKRRLARHVAAKARQALGHLRRITHLAELAVADDGDARGLLLRHGLIDCRLGETVKSCRVIRLAMIAGRAAAGRVRSLAAGCRPAWPG
jgi:hypothetical protein